MKLLSLSNRYYLFSTILFLLAAGIVIFLLIRYYLNAELNEQLQHQRREISDVVSRLDSIPAALPLFGVVSVQPAIHEENPEARLFDSVLIDEDHEPATFRLLQFTTSARMASYEVMVGRKVIEMDDIAIGILLSLLGVIAFFGLIQLWMNTWFSRRLWAPFLTTLSRIQSLDLIHGGDTFRPLPSRVDEFSKLNESLAHMFNRLQSDFLRTKEFTANASHELQTPLAVIQSKLEALMQREGTDEGSMQLIQDALHHVSRMSRLIQTLLVLSKIENRRFEQAANTSVKATVEKFLSLSEAALMRKKIEVRQEGEADFLLHMHPQLADVLISNLVSNAVSHSTEGGFIAVHISPDEFVIANSGLPPDGPPDEMFARFRKGNQQPDHLGLGLSLVKEIADAAQLQVRYSFQEGIHTVVVRRRAVH